MNKTKKMRLQLAKLLTMYAEKPTEEGLILVSENDFALGSEIFVLTDDGNIEICPDGIYHVEKTTYTVADGLIASIEEIPDAVAVVEEDKSLVGSEIEIIKKQLEEALKGIDERDMTIKDLNDQLNKTVEGYEATIKNLNDKLNKTVQDYEQVIKDLNNTIATLEKTIAELSGKSGKPEVEETIEEEVKEEEMNMKKNTPKTNGVALIKKFRK